MNKIRKGDVRMKPKIYFILGSVAAFIGLISSFIFTVFLINLTQFALRTHGPMGQYRLEQLLQSFPWWAPILSIVGLIAGVRLLRKYDFSYKKNYWLIIGIFIGAVIISVWIVDSSGLGDLWFRRGPMRGFMKQYMQNNNQQQIRPKYNSL